MVRVHDLIRKDLREIHSKVNPDFEGDLTHKQVRAMLTLVRRLKTRLEVIDADFENKI